MTSVLTKAEMDANRDELLIHLAYARYACLDLEDTCAATVADLAEADVKVATLELENQELRQQVEDLKGEVAYLASQVESYDDVENQRLKIITDPNVNPTLGGIVGDFSGWQAYSDEDGGTTYVT